MKFKSCTQMSIYIKRNEEVFGPFSIEDHLFKVATLTTFAMCVLSSSFLHDSSFQRILMNAVAAFAIMGLGGAISYLFKRP
jgi:hypothetical protein